MRFIQNHRGKRPRDISDVFEYEGESVSLVRLSRGASAIISAQSIPLVSPFTWSMNNAGYAVCGTLLMHILILGCPKGMRGDHRNRIRIDNRISNLRIVTYSTSSVNRNINSNNKSGYVGVYWSNQRSKWVANITLNRKCKSLGYFLDIDEAVSVRRKAEIEYFGESYGAGGVCILNT